MFIASEWVRQVLAASQEKAMSTEAVLKSLEKYAGHGDKALGRVQSILEYIDGELVDRKGGQGMRDLWATVADYLEKVQEAQAAA